MLTDKSENFEETWNFLDRRLEDIKTLGSTINYVKQFFKLSNILTNYNL